MNEAIATRGLVKSYGSTLALDGVDLSVSEGEIHGFLGPNGAGKSTTVRILLGLLRGDAGEARLLGGDPWHDAVELHRRLAYVPGDVNLWPSLTGGEAIDLLASLRVGLDPRASGRDDRALPTRPHQELLKLLQGQPPEGRDRRRVRLGRRAVPPRRADLRPRPAHGDGVPGRGQGASGPGSAPRCCRATSSRRRRRSATG